MKRKSNIGKKSVATVYLGRLTNHFMLCAKFTESIIPFRKITGCLEFIIVNPKKESGTIIVLHVQELDRVRKLLKRLGFKRISSLPKKSGDHCAVRRWINFESSTLR